jgi:hypothetical protein
MNNLQHLEYYINNTEDAVANFNLGLEYELMGQTACAASFYLRSAERSDSEIAQYESLLRLALCFERQGLRDNTEEAILQKAILLISDRPEAYFLIARLYEVRKDWQSCYTYSSLALRFCNLKLLPLNTNVEYPGEYALYFQKGVAAWWVGEHKQSQEIMADLKYSYNMAPAFANAVDNNLNNIGYPVFPTSPYRRDMVDDIRYKFKNIEDIGKNYSQSYQDIFVLTMLDGKKNGTYVEIGSAEPFKGNNTALLETVFGWKGVSLDINPKCVDEFKEARKNPVVCADAMEIVDYIEFFKDYGLGTVNTIDFLQVDCDPPSQTFAILKKIPFNDYKFATISFEHDYYADTSIRDQSRQFLKSKGYVLVASDIAYDKVHSYEDWWAHPDLVKPEILSRMLDNDTGVKYAKSYMFPSYK